MVIEDRIREIEEEIKKTPYNKATSHHIGKLKAKLSKLKEDALTRSSTGGKVWVNPSRLACSLCHSSFP